MKHKIALHKTGNIFAPQFYPGQSGSVWPIPTVAILSLLKATNTIIMEKMSDVTIAHGHTHTHGM